MLLPIGIALAWIGESGIRQANSALEGRNEDQSRAAARAIESLIARNALALRVAANGALATARAAACDARRESLATAPAIAQSFELETGDGKPLCTDGGIVGDTGELPLVAPGDIRVRHRRRRHDGVDDPRRSGRRDGDSERSGRRAAQRGTRRGGDISSLVLRDGATRASR